MRRQRWWVLLMAVVLTSWTPTLALPVPDEELDMSTKLLGSSVVTSVSVVTGSSENGGPSNNGERSRINPSKELPGSPAGLLRPDRFQFYTLNKDGNVVTKQMTQREIQSLIAAGGGHIPMEIQEPQSAGEVPTGGMKVADVVQNVQNVLKSELSKPATVMTSMPTIPGHANNEWSSILPAILGGESEDAPVDSQTLDSVLDQASVAADATLVKVPTSSVTQASPTKLPATELSPPSETAKPSVMTQVEIHTEKPMIQVPVITVDQKLPTQQEAQEDSTPIFQMLNTISAEKVNAKNKTVVKEKPEIVQPQKNDLPEKVEVPKPEVDNEKPSNEASGVKDSSNDTKHRPEVSSAEKKPSDKPTASEIPSKQPDIQPTSTVSVVSVAQSTSMKVSGQQEIPLHQPAKPLIVPVDQNKLSNQQKTPEAAKPTAKPLDSTTVKAEPSAPAVQQAAVVETTKEPGLLAQGVSFFGNLPQLVSDFISNNAPSSGEADKESEQKPVKTSEVAPQGTKRPQTAQSGHKEEAEKAPETTSGTKKPEQETVYQQIPEIVPDKKTPLQSTSSSEASSIEHIIETLNDPSSTLTGAVAADHFTKPTSEPTKIVPQTVTEMPTKSTPPKIEIPVESSSSKPVQPLPTELADSLSSMISQISDEMPSVLTVGQNAGLDTSEKKNTVDMQAEEPESNATVKNATKEVTKVNGVEDVKVSTEVDLPKVTATQQVEKVIVKEDVEKTTATENVPKVTATEDIPKVTVTEDVTKVTATEDVTKVTATEDASKVAATEDLPKVTTTEDIPKVTVTEDVEKMAATEEVPKVTSAEDVQKATEAASSEAPPTTESSQSEVSKTGDGSTKAEAETSTVTPALLLTEQANAEGSTIVQSVTTQVPSSEASSTVKSESVATEQAMEGIDQSTNKTKPADKPLVGAAPVGEQPEISLSASDKSKPEADALLASSDIATDRIVTAAPTQQPSLIKETTQSANQVSDFAEKLSDKNPTTGISGIVATTAQPDKQEEPLKVQESSSPIDAQEPKPEVQRVDATTRADINEDTTEVPIVHIAITEAKPTDMFPFDTSPGADYQDNGTESPLVRIKLADPVTMVNNMIQSASLNANATTPQLVPLALPENANLMANNAASGLIAGYPSSTQSTSEEVPIKEDSVKSEGENKPTGDNPTKKADDHKDKVEIQVENATKVIPEASEDVTKVVEGANSSTLKDQTAVESDVKLQTDSPAQSADPNGGNKATTVPDDVAERIVTDKPGKEDSSDVKPSKVVQTEASAPSAASSQLDDQNSTKSSESEAPAVENVTTVATGSGDQSGLQDPTIIPETTLTNKPEEGVKVIESINDQSGKPESPVDTTESKIPEKHEKLENHTNSTLPIVRLDAAPEGLSDEMPLKIQLTDLPIKTTAVPAKTSEDVSENVQEEKVQVATTQEAIKSTGFDELSPVTSENPTEKVVEKKDEAKLEEVSQEAPKMENSSDAAEKILESSSTAPTSLQTEEVRIQVNETAVLVTKRPVSEASGASSGDVQKTTVNQPADQSTTPKSVPVREEPLKVDEMERIPVPIKISELSSNEEAAPAEEATPIKTEPPVSSVQTETDTRTKYGEQDSSKETTTVRIEDSTAIKESESSTSQSDAKVVEDIAIVSTTTKVAPTINEETTTQQDKDSNVQSSAKVELTTGLPVEKHTTAPKVTTWKPEDKPTKINDKKPATEKPSLKIEKPTKKPELAVNKQDEAVAGSTEEKWTLIPQQVFPALTKNSEVQAKQPATTETPATTVTQAEVKITTTTTTTTPRPSVPLDHPQSASGLDSTVKNLDTDISYFVNLCNELAFTFWTATNKGLSTSRSLAVSPFGMTSMLAMVFLGARGPTSDQMNDVLKLDDVASFNPHLVFQNVTDAVNMARNQGIANAAFVRELFADRSKVRKLMPFYKEQAQQFYDGIVAEVNFSTISDLVRRRTNLMIRKQTGGRIKDFVRTNTVPLRSPLAAMSANVFQTNCNSSAASSEGRDGELYFAVSPAVRQRKLVPVPATVWRAGVLAGYEPSLDATAISLGGVDKLVSTIFVIPGQQGHTAPGDSLDLLEQRFIRGATHDGAWNKLLKVLIPRPGLELQVPKFSHRSVINATAALKRMGLEELFSKHADLKGINGLATDLHLADVLQMNLFSTCGDENILNGRHHVEVYPGSPLRNAREHRTFEDEKDEFLNDLAEDEKAFSGLPIPYEGLNRQARSAKPRQTESTEKPRLKLDRPFLYFVRHNPTGLILHMGRFNPRLLP